MAGTVVRGSAWLCGPGENPFNLPMPPPWWLTMLVSYDADLAIMPSKKECAYRLVQKAVSAKPMGLIANLAFAHPDTVAMIKYGVVPVATVPPWAVRSDKIIRDLMKRDVRRTAKNADAYEQQVLAHERAQEEKSERDLADDLQVVSGDALRSLRFRTGQAVSMTDVQRGRRGRTAASVGTRVMSRPVKAPSQIVCGSSPLPGPRIVLATD